MKLGIMQPYFFPYLGYFQLIHAVDRFVLYDDVQFIKGGWINRNKLLIGNKPMLISVPLDRASPNKQINEIELFDFERWSVKFLRTLRQTYGSASNFGPTFQLIDSICSSRPQFLRELLLGSLRAVIAHLGISTRLVETSSQYGNVHLRGQERIIDICHREHATAYVNAPGGRHLYDTGAFAKEGIDLGFLSPVSPKYRQFDEQFHPNLSMIDVLMFNSVADVREMLTQGSVDFSGQAADSSLETSH